MFSFFRHYMDWSVNTIQFLALKEVHDIFKAGAENIVVSPHRKTAPNLWKNKKLYKT